MGVPKNKYGPRTGEMTQSVKYMLCKQEDLSSGVRDHIKAEYNRARLKSQCWSGRDGEIAWNSRANHLSQSGELQVQ